MENLQQKLLSLIAEDKLEEVFQLLKGYSSEKGDYALLEKTIMQSGRYQNLKEQNNLNVINQADYQLELSKIRKALIDSIKGVSNADLTKSTGTRPSTAQSSIRFGGTWKIVLAVVLLLGITIIGLQLAGVSSKAKPQDMEAPVKEQQQLSDQSGPQQQEEPTAPEEKKEEVLPNEVQKNTSTPAKKIEPKKEGKRTPIEESQTEAVQQPAEKMKKTPPVEEELPQALDEVLKIEVRTNKGTSNLRFKGGEKMRLYFKVNRPCYVRTFYNLADNGGTVLFDSDRQVQRSEINQFIEIGDGFFCAPPFGEETLYVIAKNQPFEKLSTVVDGGYEFVNGGATVAVNQSKPKGFVKDIQLAEKKLRIITQQ